MRLSTALPDDPRPLARLIQVTIGLMVGWLWWFTPWEDGLLRLAATTLVVLALWPISRWVQRRDDRYPLVETMLAVTLPFYALPLLIEHRLLLNVPVDILVQALLSVVVFQASLLAGAAAVPRHRRALSSPLWSDPIIPEDRLPIVGYGMLLNTGWLFIATFTDWVPAELTGSFRALFFGIGLISAFTLARLWAQHDLSGPQKLALVANLVAQLALIATSLLLIHALTLVGVVALGYFSHSRRVPWALLLPSLVVFTVLHHGKAQMRERYWDEGQPRLEATALPGFFAEWFERGLHQLRQPEHGGKLLLLERSSLLQVAAFVVAQVPDRVTPLEGESYRTIPLQVVPRMFWPDKPSPTESINLLAVELGLLTREQAESTSIGFGMIAESYANFQLYGPVLLGLILGLGLQWVAVTTAGAAAFSFQGLLRVLVLAWCLNAEVTAALWLSSLYQACIAVFVPLFAWRFLTSR